jgi:hypothetical protein
LFILKLVLYSAYNRYLVIEAFFSKKKKSN